MSLIGDLFSITCLTIGIYYFATHQTNKKRDKMIPRVLYTDSGHVDTMTINDGKPMPIDNLTQEQLLELLAREDVIILSKIHKGE